MFVLKRDLGKELSFLGKGGKLFAGSDIGIIVFALNGWERQGQMATVRGLEAPAESMFLKNDTKNRNGLDEVAIG
ncbi:hypothetical protein TNCV_2085671 [Trichonephila clavipes]|nr:hypothetical protein TNCV_2085671 [Trichonephila clavipes]